MHKIEVISAHYCFLITSLRKYPLKCIKCGTSRSSPATPTPITSGRWSMARLGASWVTTEFGRWVRDLSWVFLHTAAYSSFKTDITPITWCSLGLITQICSVGYLVVLNELCLTRPKSHLLSYDRRHWASVEMGSSTWILGYISYPFWRNIGEGDTHLISWTEVCITVLPISIVTSLWAWLALWRNVQNNSLALFLPYTKRSSYLPAFIYL